MPFFFRSKKQSALVAGNISGVTTQPSQHSKSATTSNGAKPTYIPRARAIPQTYRSIDSEKKEIRLLKLLPGKTTDPLRCTTHITSLLARKVPAYETISYCWGNNPVEGIMDIDSNPTVVTQSAIRALHRVRHATKECLLWIDAVCINQCDDIEKSDQVFLMGDIYRCGRHNLVWLGDCGDQEEMRVEQALEAVVQNIKRATNNREHFKAIMNSTVASKSTTANALSRDINFSDLMVLYRSPWFRRLWVAQEAALSSESTCHFGKGSFSLTDVLDVAVWLLYHNRVLPPSIKNEEGIYAARSMWHMLDRRGTQNTDMFMAYVLTQNFLAKNPRDHVFALAGLYQDLQPHLRLRGLLLRPNYARATADVFRDATRACIEDSSSLQALQFVQPARVPPGSPSWMLQFDAGPTGLDDDPLCRLDNGFRADGNLESPVMFFPENTLKARGFDIDCIGEYSPRFSQARSYADNMEIMVQAGSLLKRRRIGKDWVGELGSLLIAGRGDKQDDALVQEFRRFLKSPTSNPSQHSAVLQLQQPDEKSFRATRWFSRFEKTMYGRRCFITEGGLAGIGPLEMKPDDRIVVLCGGSVPYVLRRLPEERTYVLVGVCYVFDIMHGEVKDYLPFHWLSIL